MEMKEFRITLKNGSCLSLTNLGARMTSLTVPDKRGRLTDILLGYSDTASYLNDTCYFGATIGRFANRIRGGGFTIDGIQYHLDKNDGDNTNHGGQGGFDKKMWKGRYDADGSVVFTLQSPHLDGGFPGNLQVEVCYGFSENGVISIDYRATTDQKGYVNLTNHAYFNLDGSENIYSHRLQIYSNSILETDRHFIPCGKVLHVEGSEFDFSESRAIGKRMEMNSKQLLWNRGYNHYYLLSEHDNSLQRAATAQSPLSGIGVVLYTTYPGFLFYSGGYIDSPVNGKGGKPYRPAQGFCLEAQYFPDSPHHATFPCCLLNPGEEYRHRIEYRLFSTG